MNETDVERSLRILKDRIPINEVLKRRLLEELIKRHHRTLLRKWGSLGTAVAILLMAVGVWKYELPGIQKVEAAALHIQNQVSFINMDSADPVGSAEYKGAVYVPVAGQGLFAYDNAGFHLLTEQNIDGVKVNRNGTKLIGTMNGSVGIFDLKTRNWTELASGNGTTEFYEQPSWKDENAAVYVKKNTESGESGMYELDMRTKQLRKLGDGSYPSYVGGKQAIVYQKETADGQQIVYKETNSGKETVIDDGRYPVVSPDGKYIAYVKTEQNRGTLQPDVFVKERLDNVWIADLDGKTKRAVTANVFNEQTDRYYNPVWGSDSRSLNVWRNKDAEQTKMTLMRIDLSAEALKAEETVQAFNQAVLRRDEDFARSLRTTDFVIASNPHLASYFILGSGKEGDREYVDTKESRVYTAQPFYTVYKARYYVSKKNHQYVIDEDAILDGGVRVAENDNGAVELETSGGKQTLFAKEDITEQLRPQGKFRFASLVYLERSDSLVLSLQGLGDAAAVHLIGYDVAKRTFKSLARIDNLNGKKQIVVEDMIVSPDENYIALNVSSEEESPSRNHIVIYDVNQNSTMLLEKQLTDTDVSNMNTYLWDRSGLHFTLMSRGQTLYYKWNPAAKKVERP